MRKKKEITGNPLLNKHLIGYALGDLGGCLTFGVLGSFLTPYYTEVAGMTMGSVALMFIFLKVWDAINDPLMGALMDKAFVKHQNKHGKFRPWMMRATPLVALFAVLMFTAPSFVTGTARMLVAIVTYLLYEASYTMFNIPYGSLLSAMSNTDKERATLSSARGFGSIIGNILPMVIFPFIIDATTENPKFGYAAGIIICAVLGLISCLLSCKLTTERNIITGAGAPKPSDIKFTDILIVFKKNRAFVALCIQGLFFVLLQGITGTLGIYMYRDVLGSLTYMGAATAIAAVLSVPFLLVVPKVADKFGLERTVRTCQLIGIGLFILLFLLPNNVFAYLILSTLASGFASLTVLMQWGMVGEAIDYNEYITGKRTEGSIYGTFNLMRRIGQAIGASAAVFLLELIGYVPNAEVQTQGVLQGIKFLVIGLPAILVFICWLSLKFVWNITPEIRGKMAQFKLDKAEAIAAENAAAVAAAEIPAEIDAAEQSSEE